MEAAWIGSPELTQLLIERGAELNAIGKEGKTALGLALLVDSQPDSQSPHGQAVRILKKAGAKE